MQTIYIDTSKSPRTSLIRSLDSTTPAQMLDVVSGDVMPLTIRFSDSTVVSSSVTQLTASIGLYSGGTYCSSSNWFLSSSWGVTGSIFLSSSALNSALGSSESVTATFTVKVSDRRYGSVNTYLLTPITIWKNIA